MDLKTITPVILTYNEAPNIGRVLERLQWAHEIVIVDSGSSDETEKTAAEHPNVKFLTRAFDTHATQWNFALEQTATEWVLTLDADYILSNEFIDKLSALPLSPDINGYFAAFTYCIWGRPLRGSLLPPRCLLFRKQRGCYIDDGHTQLLSISGPTAFLNQAVLHDDRKPLSRWLRNQGAYAALEAEKLCGSSLCDLSTADRLRRLLFITPWLAPFWALFVRGAILSGWHGVYYALQRSVAEATISLALIERSLRRGNSSSIA